MKYRMSRQQYSSRSQLIFVGLLITVACTATPRKATHVDTAAKSLSSADGEPRHTFTVPAGAVLRVTITAPFNTSKLQPGQVLEGKMAKPVFVGDQEVISQGVPVDVMVEQVAKPKTGIKGKISRIDSMRTLSGNRNISDEISFKAASVKIPDELPVPLNVSFVQGGYIIRLHSHKEDVELGGLSKMEIMGLVPFAGNVTTAFRGKNQWQMYRHPILTLRLQKSAKVVVRGELAPPPVSFSGELASGTHARLLLLNALGSETSKENDKFTARVLQPIEQDGQPAIPEGSVIQGHVTRIETPRRMSRAGAVHLGFDKVYLGKRSAPMLAAALQAPDAGTETGAPADPSVQKKSVRKTVYDKGSSMVKSEAGSDAMEVASYFTPPLASTGLGLAMYMGRRGREVSLPRMSEMEIIFDAPVKIAAQR